MPAPAPFYARIYNFLRAQLAGQAIDPSKIDGELDRLLLSVNQLVRVTRGITDANGRLVLQQPLREMDLIEVLRFTATASQTQFYLAPIGDPLTDKAQFLFNTTGDLYATFDQSKVSLAAATGWGGTVTAVNGSNIYTFTTAVPETGTTLSGGKGLIGCALTVNGVSVGTITAVTGTYTVTTTIPWPNTGAGSLAYLVDGLGLATLTPTTPLSAGLKVQVGIYSDGAGALTQLGTASATTGAVQIAIEDAGALFAATDVENALQEDAANLAAFIASVGALAEYVKRDGSVAMTGALAMGTHKITGLSPGTTAGDAVEYSQVQSILAIASNLTAYFLKRDGTDAMAGDLSLAGYNIKNLKAGVNATDGANKAQVDARIHKDGSVAMEADLDLNTHKITGLSPGTGPTDAVNLAQLTAARSGGGIAEYRTAGSFSVLVPDGVTVGLVEMWGAGGGGSAADPGGGGGAGGYVYAVLPVVSGESLTFVVGAGGAVAADGGATQIKDLAANILLEAAGGLKGVGGVGGVGGGGSSPTPRAGTSYTTIQGGRGRQGYQNPASGMAIASRLSGDGGHAARGGLGGVGQTTGDGGYGGGSAGQWPGGGGSGAGYSAAGFAGADGGIVVRWS